MEAEPLLIQSTYFDGDVSSSVCEDDINCTATVLTDNRFSDKVKEMKQYLEKEAAKDLDSVSKLRSYAVSEGGFVTDEIRKCAWPMLLELEDENMEPCPDETEFKSHIEFSQVVLDVNRSIKRFPPGIPYNQRVAMQDQLIRLILRVITRHPQLQYYQGYHDVAITFLLVVGENTAFHIMEKLSITHLKHFMEATMETTAELLDYIFPIIDHVHPELCSYIEKAEVGSMFCLPWFLTWYSHTLTKYESVMRLYDYFLASEPLMPLYLVPSILIYRQDVILATECELSSLHQELSQLPEDLPFDHLLKEASSLYDQFPPDEISEEAALRRIKIRQLNEENWKLRRSARKEFSVTKNTNSKWQFMHRVIPAWFLPYLRLRVLVLSTSFAVGLYAYYRYRNNSFEGYSQHNMVATR